jgi:hypothetical protein
MMDESSRIRRDCCRRPVPLDRGQKEEESDDYIIDDGLAASGSIVINDNNSLDNGFDIVIHIPDTPSPAGLIFRGSTPFNDSIKRLSLQILIDFNNQNTHGGPVRFLQCHLRDSCAGDMPSNRD